MSRRSRRIIPVAISLCCLVVFPANAYGDNCGSLSDCYGTVVTGVLALIAIAAVMALLFIVLPEILPFLIEGAEAEEVLSALEFGETDLVYGPSADGALRELAEQAGGRLLNDLPKTTELTFEQFSLQTLDKAAESGNMIRFDLTHAQDIPGMLSRTGEFAERITAAELRHIQTGWKTLKDVVKFYFKGREVPPPW